MADIDEFDFDNDWGGFDDASDFNFDPMDGEENNDRTAISRVSEGALKTVLSMSTARSLGRATKAYALPEGYKNAVDTLDSAMSFGHDIYSTAKKELKPASDALKSIVRTNEEKIDRFLPKWASSRLKSFSEDTRRPEIDSQEASIQAAMTDVFGSRDKEEAKRTEYDLARDAVNAKVGAEQHNRSMDAMGRISMGVSRLVGYQDSVMENYQRKSLDLQMRQYFVLKDMLTVSKASSDVTKTQLAAIVKNSALPDIVKMEMAENYKQVAQERLFGKMAETSGDLLRKMIPGLKKNIMGKVTEFTGTINDVMGSLADASSMAADMSDSGIDGLTTAGEVLGGVATDAGAGTLAKWLGTKLKKNPAMAESAASIQYLLNNIPQLMGEFGRGEDMGIDISKLPGGKLINKVSGVFSKKSVFDASGDNVLISAQEFKVNPRDPYSGYVDAAGNDVKSHADIKGAVYDKYGNEIITAEQYRQGLKFKADDTGGSSSGLAGAVRELIPESVARRGVVNNLNSIATEQTGGIDQITRRTWIEIIPGYLSRILQQVTNIATGTENERVVYSTDSESFTSESEATANLTAKLFNQEDLGKRRSVATDTAKEILGENAVSEDAMEALVNKLIMLGENSGRFNIAKLREGDLGEGVDPAVAEEIKKALSSENNEFSSRRIESIDNRVKRMAALGRPSLDALGQYSATGQKELLRNAGLITNTARGDVVNNKYIDRRLLGLDGEFVPPGTPPGTPGALRGPVPAVPTARPPLVRPNDPNYQNIVPGQVESPAEVVAKAINNLSVKVDMGRSFTDTVSELMVEVDGKKALPVTGLGNEQTGGGNGFDFHLLLNAINENFATNHVLLQNIADSIQGDASDDVKDASKGIMSKLRSGTGVLKRGLLAYYKGMGRIGGSVLGSAGKIGGSLVDRLVSIIKPSAPTEGEEGEKEGGASSKLKGLLETLSNPLKSVFGLQTKLIGKAIAMPKMAMNYLRGRVDAAKDAFVAGEEFPRLKAIIMANGGYFSKLTGKPIFKIGDIDGDVVDAFGKIVLSADDFRKGLVDRLGIRIDVKGLRGLLGAYTKRALGIGKNILSYGKKKLTNAINTTAKIGKSIAMGAGKIINGGYDGTAGFVKRGLGIRPDMPDVSSMVSDKLSQLTAALSNLSLPSLALGGSETNAILNKQLLVLENIYSNLSGEEKEEEQTGYGGVIYGPDNKPLSVKAPAAPKESKWNDEAELYITRSTESIKAALNTAVKAIRPSDEGEMGNEIDTDDKDTENASIKSYLSESLDTLRTIAGEDKKAVAGDATGDGVRDNSWRDILARRKQAKEDAANKKGQEGDSNKEEKKEKSGFGIFGVIASAAASIVGAIGSGLASIGTMIAGLMGMKTAGDILGDIPDVDIGNGKKGGMGGGKGKGIFNKLKSLASKVGSKIPGAGMMGKAAGIASKAGSALASGVGTVARTAASGVGTVARMALPAAASVASSAVGATAAALGTSALVAGAVIAGGVVAAGAIAYGGYKLYKHLYYSSDVEPLEGLRFAQYGAKSNDSDFIYAIRQLEESVLDEISVSGGEVKIDEEPAYFFEEHAEDFGRSITSEAEAVEWTTWFVRRFMPIFILHWSAAQNIDDDIDLDDVDDEMDDEHKRRFILAVQPNKDNLGVYRVTACPMKDRTVDSNVEFISAYIEKLLAALSANKDLDKFDPLSVLPIAAKKDKGDQTIRGQVSAYKEKVKKESDFIDTTTVIKPGKMDVSTLLNKADTFKSMDNEGGLVKTNLTMPVKVGRISSPFGDRLHPIKGAKAKHGGIDIAAPTGTPVVAAGDGEVIRKEYSKSYGNVVYLKHDDGKSSRYAHLSTFSKNIGLGTRVTKGDTLGAVGSTGNSTGPHLHFEYLNGLSQTSERLNPLNFMNPSIKAAIDAEEAKNKKIASEPAEIKDDGMEGVDTTLTAHRSSNVTKPVAEEVPAASPKGTDRRRWGGTNQTSPKDVLDAEVEGIFTPGQKPLMASPRPVNLEDEAANKVGRSGDYVAKIEEAFLTSTPAIPTVNINTDKSDKMLGTLTKVQVDEASKASAQRNEQLAAMKDMTAKVSELVEVMATANTAAVVTTGNNQASKPTTAKPPARGGRGNQWGKTKSTTGVLDLDH